jgi:putative membrane protein
MKSHATPSAVDPEPAPAAVPILRTIVAGGLMGFANLVPGVSGGTMVLIMGVYRRFVDGMADVTRGRFSKQSILFLAILCGVAGLTFVGFSGIMSDLVERQTGLMYALFLGMTLAGTPVLWRMAELVGGFDGTRIATVVLLLLGTGSMATLAFTEDTDAREEARELREKEGFQPTPAYTLDVVGGALAMSAMVLPGISGAYMLLVLGRYEEVTKSVSLLKDAVLGEAGAFSTSLAVVVPFGIGALLSVVLLTNVLKWLLAKYTRPMGGLLLGVLWGSTFAIWPFTSETTSGGYVGGVVAFIVGFAVVLGLTLLAPDEKKPQSTPPASR